MYESSPHRPYAASPPRSAAIERCIDAKRARREPLKSPMTGKEMQRFLLPNHVMRSLVAAYKERK